MKQHILAVGADQSLLYTRGLLLEKTGGAVTTTTYDQALPLLQCGTFKLLVLCHTLSNLEVSHLCLAVRESLGKVNILLLETPGGALRTPVEVDSRFALDEGPELFIRTAQSLLAGPAEGQQDGSRARGKVIAFVDTRTPAARQPLGERLGASSVPGFASPLAAADGKS